MRTQVLVLVLLLSVFWVSAAGAQGVPQVEPPPLVRFVGAMYPLEDKERKGLPTLTVSIHEAKWIFRIVKIRKLTGGPTSELRLLKSLFPPQIHFTGPEKLLRPLQDPEIVGKPLVIEGHLYSRDRMLFVTAVEEVTEKP